MSAEIPIISVGYLWVVFLYEHHPFLFCLAAAKYLERKSYKYL